MKLGRNTRVIVCMSRSWRNFDFFPVKGSLFPKQRFLSILGALRVTGVTAQHMFWTFILSSRPEVHAKDVPFQVSFVRCPTIFGLLTPEFIKISVVEPQRIHVCAISKWRMVSNVRSSLIIVSTKNI